MTCLRPFSAAPIVLLGLALAGCGGGGSGAQQSAMALLPPVAATPASDSAGLGPVEYLQNSSPLSSSGTIGAGTRQALVAVMSSATIHTGFAADTFSIESGAGLQSAAIRAQSAGRATAPLHAAPVEAFAADDRELLSRLGSMADPNAPQTARTQSFLPATLSVGATAPLWVQHGSLSSTTRTSSQVPSTLLAQSAHGNIWIDDSLLSGPASSAAFSAGQRTATLAQISADFENAYASDTAHFASPDYSAGAPALRNQYKACSASGSVQGTTGGYIAEPADRRINVLIVNTQNLGGLGGYFSGANYMHQAVLNCLNGTAGTYESNEAPFIFVGWYERDGSDYELREDLVRSTAHELQHLINFVNHALLASAASNASYDGNEAPFINEGLSMLAQDLAVESMYGSQGIHFDTDDALARANAYLSNPAGFSISGFDGIDSASWGGDGTPAFNCGGGCYGGAYLFQRYLRDRFGEDAYTHGMETSGVVGGANLQAVTRENAGSLLDDFALAMAGDSLGVTPADSRFAFGSLHLTRAYADQFGGSATLGGVYSTPLTSGGALVNAPVGGFAFVSVPAVPAGGMPVSVTDRAAVSGFGLAAGLAQH